METKFELGQYFTIGNAMSRWLEDTSALKSEMISAEEANRRYAISSVLRFDQPTPKDLARLLHERKRAELARMAYLEAADHKAMSLKAVAGFLALIAGHLAHPIDFCLVGVGGFIVVRQIRRRRKMLAA